MHRRRPRFGLSSVVGCAIREETLNRMLYDLNTHLVSRAATAENPQAAVGAGGTTGRGRKGSPCIEPLAVGETATLLDVRGRGVIRHIWCTIPADSDHLRNVIVRMYWDDSPHPSVEVPIGDFFGVAHGMTAPMESECVSMQEGRGFNSWIPMPFRESARITVENDAGSDVPLLFYQVDFTLGDDLARAGYFHARFARTNPCPLGQDYVILDDVQGPGVYLGTVLGIRNLFPYLDEWWGEGEVKFFIDEDDEYPTICGTGTEDYIGSAWGTGVVCTPYQGAPLIDDRVGLYSLYRFHVKDPIYFSKSLKVTIQQIGAGSKTRALEAYGDAAAVRRAVGTTDDSDLGLFDRSDDYSSVAYWYQATPGHSPQSLPTRSQRTAGLEAKDKLK